MTSKGLKIRITDLEKNFKKLVLNGVIDGHTSSMFDKTMEEVIHAGTPYILLDFSHVKYLSSAGIGVLISAQARLDEEFPGQPTVLMIMKPSEGVMDVFHILEIEETFKFPETDQEARDIIKSL